MQSIAQLVTASLARHNFQLAVDPRRLQWSPWFRCDSAQSLLTIPSRPGIVVFAEKIACPPGRTRQGDDFRTFTGASTAAAWEGHDFSAAAPAIHDTASADEVPLVAVLDFSECNDMAFVLDRLFTPSSPLRARLTGGHLVLRYVVIEDPTERRSLFATLNRWRVSSAERGSPNLPNNLGHRAEACEIPTRQRRDGGVNAAESP